MDTYSTVCPECEGAGEIRHPRWGSRSCPEPTLECPLCHGRQEVSLQVAQDWDDEHFAPGSDTVNPSRRDEAERLVRQLAEQLRAAADTWKELADVRYPETDEDIDPAAEDEDMIALADSLDAAANAASHILEDLENEKEEEPF